MIEDANFDLLVGFNAMLDGLKDKDWSSVDSTSLAYSIRTLKEIYDKV